MSKSPLHIVIKRAVSKEHTTLHANLPLSSSAKTIRFFRHNGRTELCKNYDTETNVEPLALMLAEEICRIDGVDSGNEHMSAVEISKYSIRVAYGHAFDENDIEFETLVTIASVLGIDPDQVTFELDNTFREPRSIDNSSRMTWSA